MQTQPQASNVTDLLLSSCCPLQLLFGLGVLLLQLGRLLLQLVLVLQPPHLLVLQQPGEDTKDLVKSCFSVVCEQHGSASAPLGFLPTLLRLRLARPQLLPRSVHRFPQSLVGLHQVTFRVGQFAQLDGLLLVLLPQVT